jgi:hypothetical protein
MYVINNFVYGHKLSDCGHDLTTDIHEWDIHYVETINGKEFQFYFPYHGGQTSYDIASCIFGCCVSHDDGNSSYVNEVRNAKEEDYKEDYKIFIENLKKDLIVNEYLEEDDEEGNETYNEMVKNLTDFINSNEPEFYSVESSS